MKYKVKKYFSTFITYEAEAASEEEALNKTNDHEMDLVELHNNLEPWEDADEIIMIVEDV